MRWQLFARGAYSGVRLVRRLERAACGMNPYLLTLAIGLVVLDATCFVAIRVLPPAPVGLDAPVSVPVKP